MVDLTVENYDCLGTEVLNICEIIVSKGMSVDDDGRTVAGIDDEKANNAVRNIHIGQLEWLEEHGSPLFQRAVQLINLRKIYAIPAEPRDTIYFGEAFKAENDKGKLAMMKYVLMDMRAKGWNSKARMFGERLMGDAGGRVSAQVSMAPHNRSRISP